MQQSRQTHTFSSIFRCESNSSAQKQERSLIPAVLFRFSPPLSGSRLISGIAPLPCVICHSSSVDGAAVCEHPHCLQLGWLVALHYGYLCHWRAFCFTRNTALIHSAQWGCSQFLSIMRERAVQCEREQLQFFQHLNSVLGYSYWSCNKNIGLNSLAENTSEARIL